MASIMNILMIINSYAPNYTPRAFRWTPIAEKWVSEGHHVDVVCTWNGPGKEDEIINGVHVFRVGKNKLKKMKLSARQQEHKTQMELKHSLKENLKQCLVRCLRKLYNLLYVNLVWPDVYLPGMLLMRKKALSLAEQVHYSSVISISWPFSTHLVGLAVKRKHPEIKWMADTGDPFCFYDKSVINNRILYSKLSQHEERKVFQLADVVPVTCSGTAQKYMEIFPESASKIKVIPPMVNLDLFSRNDGEFSLWNYQEDVLHFVFVGTLGLGIREPAGLLALIKQIIEFFPEMKNKIFLHFVGSLGDCTSFFKMYPELNSNIVSHGTIPKQTAVSAMFHADILVNIGNTSFYQLPSKAIEYVAAGKKILNLCSIENDSTKKYLVDYPLIKNYYCFQKHSKEEIHDLIKWFFSSIILSEKQQEERKNMLLSHSKDIISAEYMQELL